MESLIKLLTKKKLKLSTAESCTGGLLASLITSVNGASKVFNLCLITYSNRAKIKYLSVSKKTLSKYGAVSKNVAEEMIDNLYKNEKTKICVSTTGVAGPTGGTKLKPVGLVYIGIKYKKDNLIIKKYFKGNRKEIQRKTTNYVFRKLSQLV